MEADPVAVNSFTQSRNSEHGPKHRASVPPEGSLLRALHDNVDEIVAKHELPIISQAERTVRPVTMARAAVVEKFTCPQDSFGFWPWLTISDMAAMALVSPEVMAKTPQCWRKVLALRRVAVKFVWSRAFDALITKVSPQISQKLATVQAVYEYVELTDKYKVPLRSCVGTLHSGDRRNELICLLGEFILLLGFIC